MRFNRLAIITAVCATLDCVAQTAYVDSCRNDTTNESSVRILKDFEIVGHRQAKAIEIDESPGNFKLGAKAMGELPRFMGITDPLRVIQSLPAVSSTDFISGGIYVQGSENAHNEVLLDDVEVFNPMHLFGLFSIFNTPHFESFDVDINSGSTEIRNFVGAEIKGVTPWYHPHSIEGEASLGIIDTHATLRIPLVKEKSSLFLSGRTTYVDLLYGNFIQIDNAPLKYGFSDFNATYLQNLSKGWEMKVGAFYSRDHMSTVDPNYSSEIALGWKNANAGVTFRQKDIQSHTLGCSYFSNKVRFNYSTTDINLPSDIYSFSYIGGGNIGKFKLGGGINFRHATPQSYSNTDIQEKVNFSTALEASINGWIPLQFGKFGICPSLKAVLYTTEGFTKLYPVPSLSGNLRLNDNIAFDVNAARRIQCTHKIEESAVGLPTDFWILAGRYTKPLDSYNFSLGMSGNTFNNKLSFSLSGFYRILSNATAWTGALFNMINSDYDPMTDVVTGKGKVYGVAGMLQTTIGPIQGWITYTWSKSLLNFPDRSCKWYPYSHDRTHDIKLNLIWHIRRNLSVSASFIYATGLPYTEALYAYMIGENLIFKFNEYNSSRLPDMHRLDLGLDWKFYNKGKIRQGLNISLFNVYANDNVMFRTFSYSTESGIHTRETKLDFILPSVSYYINF